MRKHLKWAGAAREVSPRSKVGFTLVEILMAMTIFMIVIAALFSTVFAALKLYYVNSDYLDIGGQTRRLVDDLVESGTLADDLTVFTDVSDKIPVGQRERGDVLMFYTRSSVGNEGYIDRFTCYYLDGTPPGSNLTGPVSLWKYVGTCATASNDPQGQPILDLKIATADSKMALNTYPHTVAKRVSSTVVIDALPRTGVPRPGVFTYGDSPAPGATPTVLINLPASMVARAANLSPRSNVTLSISPRH